MPGYTNERPAKKNRCMQSRDMEEEKIDNSQEEEQEIDCNCDVHIFTVYHKPECPFYE